MNIQIAHKFGKRTQIRVSEKIFRGEDKHYAEVYNAELHDSPLVFTANDYPQLLAELKTCSAFFAKNNIGVRTINTDVSTYPITKDYYAVWNGIAFIKHSPVELKNSIKQFNSEYKKLKYRLQKIGISNIELSGKMNWMLAEFTLKTEKFKINGSWNDVKTSAYKFTKFYLKIIEHLTDLRQTDKGTMILQFGRNSVEVNPQDPIQAKCLKILAKKGYYQLSIF